MQALFWRESYVAGYSGSIVNCAFHSISRLLLASALATAGCQAFDRDAYYGALDAASHADTTVASDVVDQWTDGGVDVPLDRVAVDARDAFDTATLDHVDAAFDTFDGIGRSDVADVLDATDAATACMPGAARACYDGAAATRGVGTCMDGTQTCGGNGVWSSTCGGEVIPTTEICGNGLDEDCDGTPDNGCPTQRSCAAADTPGCGMVQVAGGTFDMGDLNADSASPIQPSITVTPTLMVDAYEVTVARFRAYWDAGHPSPSASIVYPGGTLSWSGSVTAPSTTAGTNCSWTASPGSFEAHPISCVDYYTAQAFCVWDGGRLPTEAELEWISRGRPVTGESVPRNYAWGNTDPSGSSTSMCDLAQWNYCHGDDGIDTRRVGSFAASGGIYDLVGNLSEVAADAFEPYTDTTCWGGVPRTDPLCTNSIGGVTRRAGSFGAMTYSQIHAAGRVEIAPDFQGDYIGIRCVRPR